MLLGTGHAFFDTAIGRCGIGFSARGICAVRLGDGPHEQAALAAVGPRLVPPPFVDAAIRALVSHLAGRPAALDEIPLDLGDVTPFRRRVYEAARSIPRGTVLTYGALAEQLGAPGAARAVGQALAANPVPLLVPCHRVVGTGGALVGFTAPGGPATKRRLLGLEGARADA